MNKTLDRQFDLLDRFNFIQELGFKKCIYVSPTDVQHPVYSIGAPEQGYLPSEIINMSNAEFTCFVNCYVN